MTPRERLDSCIRMLPLVCLGLRVAVASVYAC